MGALLDAARARARSARACGALQPIEGEYDEIVEAGVRFAVRVLPLLGKPRPASQPLGERGRDPFDPPEPALTVDEVSPGYVCVLNKFPVLEDHLVLATRRFEPQESALDTRDFAALARWLGAEGGLGFYNAGPAAGASQPHKHLQWLPTPLGRGPEGVPIEPLLGPTPPRGRVALVEGVPFVCAQVAVDAGLAAEALRDH